MPTTSTLNSRIAPTVQYTTPTTGSTINANDAGNLTIIINPSGSLLALTLALNAAPTDGDVFTITASQAVTTFSMTGGTVIGPLTALAIASFASYIYNATTTSWFRTG